MSRSSECTNEGPYCPATSHSKSTPCHLLSSITFIIFRILPDQTVCTECYWWHEDSKTPEGFQHLAWSGDSGNALKNCFKVLNSEMFFFFFFSSQESWSFKLRVLRNDYQVLEKRYQGRCWKRLIFVSVSQ